MFSLTIKAKLIVLGLISALAFAAVTLAVHDSNQRTKDLNDRSRVSYSTRALSTKWIIARQALVHDYYQALETGQDGEIAADLRETISSDADDVVDLFERLQSRDIDRFVDAGTIKAASAHAATLAGLVRERLPAVLADRNAPGAITQLTDLVEAASRDLAETQSTVDGALKSDYGDLAENVNVELVAANSRLLMIAIPALTVMLAFMVMIALSITRPLGSVSREIRRLADGDVTQSLSGQQRRDEIGAVVQALMALQSATLRRAEADAAKDRANRERLDAEKRAAMQMLAEGFEKSVGNVVESVSISAKQSQELSEKLERMAHDTAERATDRKSTRLNSSH